MIVLTAQEVRAIVRARTGMAKRLGMSEATLAAFLADWRTNIPSRVLDALRLKPLYREPGGMSAVAGYIRR